MGLTNPSYFFLSIFIAGVILFYLFRKQYEKLMIPSNLFWEQVMNEWQASPWIEKLQRNLLLWLQLLILTLLMFALIKPFWMTNGMEGEHVIFIVDTSASMSAGNEDQSRFRMAQDELLSMIKKMNGQDITIISAGKDPEINLQNETNQGITQSRIKKLHVSYQASNMEKAVRLADSLARKKSTIIHIFSDSVEKADLPKVRHSLPIYVHNIGENGTNLSLLSFGVVKQNEGVVGAAVIENQSSQQQTIQLQVSFEKDMLFDTKIKIPANEQKVVKIPNLPKRDYYVASINANDDYPIDNERISVYTKALSNIYAIGDVNPFVIKGFETVGVPVTQVQEKDWKQEATDGIILMEGKPVSQWPSSPLFVVNPNKGKSMKLTEAIESKDDQLLQYVNFDSTYVQSAAKAQLPSLKEIANSGEIPLIEKGEHNGERVIAINFGLEDSDWPLQPGFPIFLYNSFQWLAEQQTFQGFFSPGERKSISTGANSNWKIYDARGEFIRSFQLKKENFTAPNKPGLYQIAAGEGSQYFAVVLDESEQTIKPKPSFVLNEQKHQGNKAKSEQQNSIAWFWLTLAALAILLIEWEVYRRGIRR